MTALRRYREATEQERTLRAAADDQARLREQALLELWQQPEHTFATLAKLAGVSRSRIQILLTRARNRKDMLGDGT